MISTLLSILSQGAKTNMQHLGKTSLAAYTYIVNNLDIDFKQEVPVVERQGDTLAHLTTGRVPRACDLFPMS